MLKPHKGWTSEDILALIEETIEELSLNSECQHNEHIVDVTNDTDQVIPLSGRITDRYTAAHIRFYSNSTNGE